VKTKHPKPQSLTLFFMTEQAWRQALTEGLRARRKTAADLRSDRKTAAWKIALAAHLKQTTQARNAWLAQHLHMGRTEALSSHVAKHRRGRLNE